VIFGELVWGRLEDRSERYFGEVIASLARTGAPAVVAGWQKFSPADKTFHLLLPGKPETKTSTRGSPLGPMQLTMYQVRGADNRVYMAQALDLPVAPALLGGTQDFFDRCKQYVVGDGKLVREKKISLGEYAGKDLEAAVPDDHDPMVCRARVYLVHQRVYFVFVLARKADGLGENAEAFLDSFQLAGGR